VPTQIRDVPWDRSWHKAENSGTATTSEASPQTAESCRISSQYSRWPAFPHRRIPYDGQTTAWFFTSSLGSLRGHRPTRHSPSDPASPRRACRGVRSAMPPRYLAFKEVKVCLQIPKLDPSAPHFIRSRSLAAIWGTTDVPRAPMRCPPMRPLRGGSANDCA
jgi:hypothetical protein